jgi:hypothetical protein
MSVGNGRTWSVQLPGYVGSHYRAALVFPTTHGEAGLERPHRGRPVTLTNLVDSPIEALCIMRRPLPKVLPPRTHDKWEAVVAVACPPGSFPRNDL